MCLTSNIAARWSTIIKQLMSRGRVLKYKNELGEWAKKTTTTNRWGDLLNIVFDHNVS
jgi:hypothetical protein